MRLEILYFASLRAETGCARESLLVDEALDVRGLWHVLSRRHPGLARLGFEPLVACDMSYVPWNHPLAEVKEVAFLPPVSGG